MIKRLIYVVFLTIALSAWTSPQKISSLIYPVTFSESSLSSPLLVGASNVRIDSSKSDLELIIWKISSNHALEINIDVRNVNQSILPTDEHGKLLSKVTQLGTVPWIKVYLPKHPTQTLDVSCDSKKKICQGVWKKFPYDSNFSGVVKIEANIRGLEGKVWSPQLYSINLLLHHSTDAILPSNTFSPPYALSQNKDTPPQAARVEITQFYDLLRFSSTFASLKLLSVYTWKFINDSQLRSSGFFKLSNKTLYQWIQGQSLLDVLNQDSLQTFEIQKGQNLWIQEPLTLSLSSKTLGSDTETFIRVLEFENN